MFPTITQPLATIPSQMKSLPEKFAKKKQWAKDCIDAYERIGRIHYYDNRRFLENYQMINGQFIMSHYMQNEGYKDWLSMLSNEFEIPSTLRHYDIIGKVLNNLTEKLAEFPDIFRVEEFYEEDETNEFVRTQTELLHNSVKSTIFNELKARLAAQGVDFEKTYFESEEEAMAYQQEIQQLQQAMTPAQIDKYMKTDWQGQGEIWGTHQMQVDKQRFKLQEMERVEFRDMLVTDRCFRHFYTTADGYNQETWNPVNTFFQISEEVNWVQEADYAGRMFYLTKSQILDRYGWKMNAKELKRLEKLDKENDGSSGGSGVDMTGFPYNVYAPFEDYKAYNLIQKTTGWDPLNNLPAAGADLNVAMMNRMPYVDRFNGLYRVTEVYWMSQAKFGKVIYTDPLTGQTVKENVDENFVVPEGFKEIYGDFVSGDRPNTVYWTWVNQTWKGIKICFTMSDEADEALYIDIGPMNFQFKGDRNPFGATLPICGRIFNNRNATSMSLVDLMKPHQIGYNLCMNQLYQLLEKEIGKFMVWDTNFFNTLKDWGGEDSWDKIALIAKELGHVFGDTSPQNMKGANPNNIFPKAVDMELTSQMFSRAKLAEFFEARCLSQLGISQQLMGEVKATETATGINTGINQSTLNVQRFYTDFLEYKQRCLTMNLDIAQYVQATNKDVTIMYTKSDASREFIKMNGADLLLRNMHVYVVNSQELLRQLETIKNYFVNNNTLNVSALDIVEVITSNSPSAIKAKLKQAVDKIEQMQQTQVQQQQQSIDQAGQIAEQKEARLDARNTENNETKKEVAYINTYARQEDNIQDENANNTPDSLEYRKFASQASNNSAKVSAQRESNNIKRSQNTDNNTLKLRELELKEKELKVKEKKYKTDFKIARENKNPGEK